MQGFAVDIHKLLTSFEDDCTDTPTAEEYARDKGERLGVVCDVCGRKRHSTKGGVHLLENGTDTIECQECWETFTNVNPKHRKPKMRYHVMAILTNVGTDPRCKISQLDPNETFRRNVLKHRATRGKSGEHYYGSHEAIPNFTSKAHRKKDMLAYCAGCTKEFMLLNTKKCGSCRTARYCSRECQKKDYPIHKPRCIEWQQICKEAGVPLTK